MNYEFQNKIFSFGDNIDVFEARKKDDNSRGIVLYFRLTSSKNAFSNSERSATSLRYERWLLPIADSCFKSGGDGGFYVAYQWEHFLTRLADMELCSRRSKLWIMRGAAEILESFNRRNFDGQFLGEQAIFVDEENYAVHLAFFGLAEAFCACESGPWGKGEARDYRDDIYHLAKCFEREIKEENECPESVRNCLAEDKEIRPRYPQLLRDMKSSPLFHPSYQEEISLMFLPPSRTVRQRMSYQGYREEIPHDELVENLNTTDVYVSPWNEIQSESKNKQECKFYTRQFAGVFVNGEGDRHFFVPKFYRSSEKPKNEMLQMLRVRFRCIEEFPDDRGEGYHHLTELGGQKDEVLKKWRVVPKNEKEFIEETAFQSEYCHVREIPGNVKRFAFLLSDRQEADWEEVEKLKKRHKHLDAVPMMAHRIAKNSGGRNVGIVDNITEGRTVIQIESDVHGGDLPVQGSLLIGGEQKLMFDYEFFWRRDGLLSLVAVENVDDAFREKLEKMIESTSPSAVFLKGKPGAFGNLQSVALLPEIITRDSIDKYSQIPKSGNLQEDVHEEVIPFKRQIDAVDMFQQGDIVQPSLGGILATPEEHHPVVVAESEKSYYFDKRLNKSQQDAVWHALRQKPLFLVQGPPGTGKTTVIVEMIRQILRSNPRARILVCSQTNVAVDNVLEKLPEDKSEKRHARIRKVRLASKAKAETIRGDVRSCLIDKKIHSWSKDAINRSTMAQKKSGKSDGSSSPAIKGIIKKWHAFLRDPENEDCQIRGNVDSGWLPLKTAFLKSMNVLGATCVHIAASRYRDIFGDTFDCLIVDEAGKATPAEALIPIVRARHVILIGDHKQLPPFVTRERGVRDKVREELEDEGIEDLSKDFGESLFEKLILTEQLDSCQKMLDMQRRMPKQIGDLVSKYFYEGKLKSPNCKEYAEEKRLDLPLKGDTSLVFINTADRKNPHDNDRRKSRQNDCNANVVLETLHCLDNRLRKESNAVDVAVIAGYKGQVELLQKRIKSEEFHHLKCDIKTVDGFQGLENTVVIYDTVRSSSGNSSIGFLDEPRRLNVALSRAQKLLIIVGNVDYLINRAQPVPDLNPNQDAKCPILGEITREILKQGNVFKSLENALE